MLNPESYSPLDSKQAEKCGRPAALPRIFYMHFNIAISVQLFLDIAVDSRYPISISAC